ncbi:uncharacterized protein LOC128097911 [Peromyscus californicus insignis]|uniref:uncharacterized protein LOC128097911 n=1 Tax=Peromyscus californicus insignis TaxID=564181 RepID=UPI0022A73260|nr:uncharacterized protein LOC128097911 [Peromyscus californicus insignis]
MVPGSSLGSDVTMAPGESAEHTDQHGPNGRVALGQQHGPMWWPRPLASAWHLMASGAVDINSDPGCCRAMEPDIAPRSNPGWADTMAPGDSTGHSDLHGLGYSRPWSSAQPSLATKAMNINKDPSCYKVIDPEMAPTAAQAQAQMSSCRPPQRLVAAQASQINMAPAVAWPLDTKMATGSGPHPGHSHGLGGNVGYGHQHRFRYVHRQQLRPHVTLVPGGKQAANISPSLTALAASELPLTTAHEPFHRSFSPVSPPYTCASYWQLTAWHLVPPGRHVDASGSLDCEDPGCPMGVFCLPELHGIRGPVDL